jgi:hypothetical protein
MFAQRCNAAVVAKPAIACQYSVFSRHLYEATKVGFWEDRDLHRWMNHVICSGRGQHWTGYETGATVEVWA